MNQEVADLELELHIADCGKNMLKAFAEWEASGCFAARGEAQRWANLQGEAVRARSSGQVARMEAELGLAA